MKLKPEICRELIRRQRLHRRVRRSAAFADHVKSMAETVRDNNYLIRQDPARRGLGDVAAINYRRLVLAIR